MKRALTLALFLPLAFSLGAQEGWRELQTGRQTEPVSAAELELLGHLDTILPLFHALPPFNPPQEFHVIPRLHTDPGTTLIEGSPGPAQFKVNFGLEFFVVMEYHIVAGVRVAINDPFELLGTAFFADEESPFYLLPPTIQGAGDQTIALRSAHPVGYREVFPFGDMPPLWGQESAPFYRSVIRPHFNIVSNSALTYFTRGDKPFWKPVSRERWILALMAHGRRQLAEFHRASETFVATETTQRQIEELRRRYDRMRATYSEAETQRMYEMMLSVASISRAVAPDPETGDREYQKAIAAAEQTREERRRLAPGFIAEMDAQEEQMIQALLMRDASTQEIVQVISDGNWERLEEIARENGASQLVLLADTGRHVEALEQELAALSSAERGQPAWGFELPEHAPGPHRAFMALKFSPERPSGLVEPGSPGSRAIIALDHTFFERRSADSQPLILTVAFYHTLKGGDPWDFMERRGVPREPGLTMQADVWRNLDWRALRTIVE